MDIYLFGGWITRLIMVSRIITVGIIRIMTRPVVSIVSMFISTLVILIRRVRWVIAISSIMIMTAIHMAIVMVILIVIV